MYLFYESIIEPILSFLRPKSIVEVGSDYGHNTSNLLGYCQMNGARLHVIDPEPKYDVEEWKKKYGDCLIFHRTFSLNALMDVDRFDVVLIDGDHNWYTVFNELKLIERRCKRSQQPFPLILLHDVHWPYGRRDLYYHPENIPPVYRKPYKKLGILPDQADLVETGGLNRGFYNAIYENDPQNGVLTAVEDFTKETSLELEIIQLPGFFGLGILTPSRLKKENDQLRRFLDNLAMPDAIDKHIGRIEHERIDIKIESLEYRNTLSRLKEEHTSLQDKLEEHGDALAAEKTRAERLEIQIRKLSESLDAKESQAKDLEQELASAQKALAAKEREASRLVRELNTTGSVLMAIKGKAARLASRLQETKENAVQISAKDNALKQRQKDVRHLKGRIAQTQHELHARRRDVEKLTRLLDEIEGRFKKLLRSKRWKIGNALGEWKSTMLRQKRRFQLADNIQKTLKNYAAWKERASRPAPAAPQQEPARKNPFDFASLGEPTGKRNILVVAHNASPHIYGGERSFIDIIRAIDKHKYNIFCVFPGKSNIIFDEIRHHADEILVMRYSWWRGGDFSRDTIEQFRNIIVEKHIDLVHVNTITLIEPLLAARSLGVPAMLHSREIIDKDRVLAERIGLDADTIVRVVKEAADYVIANSKATLALFDKGNNSFLLYNGIDTRRYELPVPSSGGTLRVGLVSSNLPKKGIGDFAELAKLAYENHMDATFTLVGARNKHIDDLECRQKKGELPPNLRFVDYQSNILNCYRQLDVVINFSHFAESFGRTVAEAMALHRPVICYEWGALPELVVHGQTGFLVPYRKYKQALEHLKYFQVNHDKVAEFGERGRQRIVEHFSLDQLDDELNRIYDDILSRAEDNQIYRQLSAHLHRPAVERKYQTVKGTPVAKPERPPTPRPVEKASVAAQEKRPSPLLDLVTDSDSHVRKPIVRLLKRMEHSPLLRPAVKRLRKFDLVLKKSRVREKPKTPTAPPPRPAPADLEWTDTIHQNMLQAPHPADSLSHRRADLKIAYFMYHFPVPSETFVLNELRYLVLNGYDVKVFCRGSPYKDFRPDFPIEFFQVKDADHLAEMLTRHERNIVHSHFVYPTVTDFAWPACERAKIPFTFIGHAQDIFRYENMEKNRIGEVAASPWCLRVFVPGRFHRDFMIQQGVPAGKIIINSQTIEFGFYRFPDNLQERLYRPTRSVCNIQRFVEKKGIQDLIRAGKLLDDSGITVDIYGYGPLEERYRELIESEKARNVRLRGPIQGREALQEALTKYDLFVSPSTRAKNGDMDGIPTILMEAMAAGLPVLTTDVSSIPDLIQDKVNGFLCRPDDPEALAQSVRDFYTLDPEKVRAIIDNAKESIHRSYSIDDSVRTLLRVWRQETVDIVLVSYNNLPELKEVIRRIYTFTSPFFHLIVVDNNSDRDVVTFLENLRARVGNMTLIPLDENIMVGPATNLATENGSSKYIIYICGKEGFVMNPGWDQQMMNHMDDHPDVGLAGHTGYSPSYFDGQGYVNNHPMFKDFRNRQFAEQNLDRLFVHVQGGLFIMRRKMFEEIGGFSQKVSHNGTDVEYSYYVESLGWKLGDIPGILSLYHKTRPNLDSKFDENTLAAHPLSLDARDTFDGVAARRLKKCNICGWTGSAFSGLHGDKNVCPTCGSRERSRTLYRYLARSNLTYRGLTCLDLNPDESLTAALTKMFRYRPFPVEQHADLEMLQIEDDHANLVVASNILHHTNDDEALLAEIHRVLKPGGTALVWVPYTGLESKELGPSEEGGIVRTYSRDNIEQRLKGAQFGVEAVSYASGALEFDWHTMFACHKPAAVEKSFHCPCCGGWFDQLEPAGATIKRLNARCPRCGSLERHRLLMLFLKQKTNLFRGQMKMLHVAPEEVFQNTFKSMPNIDYLSADLYAKNAMMKIDITDISMEDDIFDVIICNHVLEHIPDDTRAMRELFRVLKPNGWAILLVPFRKDLKETYEDSSITSPEERVKHFGQHDHVRLYGQDYKDRLAKAGFVVKVESSVKFFGPDELRKYALMQDDVIFYCEKPDSSTGKSLWATRSS
jgi:glycosyltransferase involved in cell wall biosynthesis/ubiquinone/menaquinone biosynthesis C-methylase UbiE/predicted  nucleic acid-binding Zn-ribbon protein